METRKIVLMKRGKVVKIVDMFPAKVTFPKDAAVIEKTKSSTEVYESTGDYTPEGYKIFRYKQAQK